jgi:hypothetical protein
MPGSTTLCSRFGLQTERNRRDDAVERAAQRAGDPYDRSASSACSKGERRSAAIDAAADFGPHLIVKQLQIVASALRRRR